VAAQGLGVVEAEVPDLMLALQMVRQLLAAAVLVVLQHNQTNMVMLRGEQAALAALEGLLVLLGARALSVLLDFQLLVMLQFLVQVVVPPVLIFLVYLLQHFLQPVLGWAHLLNRS
jgi:hypothetical protein